MLKWIYEGKAFENLSQLLKTRGIIMKENLIWEFLFHDQYLPEEDRNIKATLPPSL